MIENSFANCFAEKSDVKSGELQDLFEVVKL